MKPKIFVSSTILDFEDLRGSIKFYLEEFGYDVQMSESDYFSIVNYLKSNIYLIFNIILFYGLLKGELVYRI